MKTKRKSVVLSIALSLLLVLSAIFITPFKSAKAEVAVADLTTGGTAYEPEAKTVTNGTIELGSINITKNSDVNNNGIPEYTATGALLTATDKNSSKFNLGTYDMSTITAGVPLIEILPWEQMKNAGGTFAPSYENFKITFSSGNKSFSLKSYSATDTYELGMGVAGENQEYKAWSCFSGGINNIGGSNKTSLLPRRLDGSAYTTIRSFLLDENGGTINHFNNKRYINPPVGYYIDPQADSFWVYADVACTGNYANAGVKPDKYDNCGQVLLGETGSQYYRFKVRDLMSTDGNDNAWVPFTSEELQNVTVTVALEGVKSESKFLVTKINGQAVTAVTGMSVINDTPYDGIALNVTDGIAKTLTSADNTIEVSKKIMLSDNDVTTPLAKVALFPKEYGSEAASTVDSVNYTQATDAGYGAYNNSNKYWKTETSEAEFNAAIATQDGKNKRDIDALYLNFTSESGKEMSVKLAFRTVDDNGAMPTSFLAKATGMDAYKSWFVTGGKYDHSNATAAASAIRFDGFVASGSEYDEKGVQQNSKGAKQDPVYAVYYDATENALYGDSGRLNQSTWTNFGTEQDPLYRWKIVDFDDFGFTGFGNEAVSLSVSVELHDKDGDEDLTDESAHVMLMSVDGQSLANDGTNVSEWTLDDCLVTFNTLGGTAVTSVMSENGGKITAPTAPTKEGYVFRGWYKEDSYAAAWDFDVDTVINDTTLYAKWAELLDITFDTNGGSFVDGFEVVSGEAFAAPVTAPTKTGYTFDGWYEDSACLIAWDFATDTATVDTTLYAKWNAVTYTITYEANGGEITANTNPATYTVEDDDITLVAPTATKTGYTFASWSVTTIDTALAQNVTVTANWSANQYTATFNVDNGTTATTADIFYDGVVTEPTEPTKTGYTFAGWFIGETVYDFATLVTGNVTLTAKWQIKTYEVTFNADGGSAVTAQTINHGATATAPTAPTKTGYTFAGWFVGTTAYDFETEVTAPVMLTAKWTINTYTVTFNANGGSAVANATVDYNTAVTAPTAPTKAGYEFAGWYADEALTTAWNFTEGKITADTTLYAKWTEVVADPEPDTTPDTTPDDTTPEDTTPDDKPAEKKGCGKEAAGLLAIVLSALAVVFVSKRK